MTINSRDKGAVGERELAAVFSEAGFDAKRGQQFKGGSDSPDVIGLPGHHVECKRVERLSIHAAIKQAVRDAGPGKVPIVCHRKNRTEWLATVRLEDYLKMLRLLEYWVDVANAPKEVG